MAANSQAALEAAAVAKVRFQTARKIWAVVRHIAHLVWVWAVEVVPQAIVSVLLLSKFDGLLAWVSVAIWWGVCFATPTFRAGMRQNCRNTLESRVLLKSRLAAIGDFHQPLVERVEFDDFLPRKQFIKCLRHHKLRAIPVIGGRVTVRPRAHQGSQQWQATYEDWLRRTFRFANAVVDPDPADPNRIIVGLAQQMIADRLIADRDWQEAEA